MKTEQPMVDMLLQTVEKIKVSYGKLTVLKTHTLLKGNEMHNSVYTVFPRIDFAIIINLEHRVTATTKRGRILNEGEYNYVRRCILKSHAHTRELHVFVTSSKQLVLKSIVPVSK